MKKKALTSHSNTVSREVWGGGCNAVLLLLLWCTFTLLFTDMGGWFSVTNKHTHTTSRVLYCCSRLMFIMLCHNFTVCVCPEHEWTTDFCIAIGEPLPWFEFICHCHYFSNIMLWMYISNAFFISFLPCSLWFIPNHYSRNVQSYPWGFHGKIKHYFEINYCALTWKTHLFLLDGAGSSECSGVWWSHSFAGILAATGFGRVRVWQRASVLAVV